MYTLVDYPIKMKNDQFTVNTESICTVEELLNQIPEYDSSLSGKIIILPYPYSPETASMDTVAQFYGAGKLLGIILGSKKTLNDIKYRVVRNADATKINGHMNYIITYDNTL